MGHEWDMTSNFQIDWVSNYPFIEPVKNANKDEPPTKCKCKICSWKYKRDIKLQLKLDAIEKTY